jgi:hypothetical protein
MKLFSIFSIIVFLTFSGCSKDSNNQMPIVEFSYQLTGLQLDRAGSAYDLDGHIISIEIKWGDENSHSATTGFSDIRVTHIYDEPGTYNVEVKAIDNSKGSTTMRFTIPVVLE